MSVRAFTLLEVLAVVVLLTLAMAAVASGVAAASDAANVRAIAAGILDLDRRARMFAGAGSRVELSIQTDSLYLVNHRAGERLAQLPLPEGTSVQMLNSDDKPLETLVVDCSGCSPDYRIVVSRGSHACTTSIAGLTGWSDNPVGGRR